MDKFIDQVEATLSELLASTPTNLRPWSKDHDLSQDRGVLVSGPRGVGKTTFLLSQAKKHGRALYLSADHPNANLFSLYELGSRIFERGYDVLIIDEVHFAKDWSQHVKGLYDSFPRKKIWISDSSSIILRRGVYDLSRRMPSIYLPLLSFREFLTIRRGASYPPFNPFLGEIPQGAWEELSWDQIRDEFRLYTQGGLRPFFAEGRYREKTLAIIEKTIFSDVPFFVENIQGSHLSLMQTVLSYLAKSPVPTLNIESLAREWAVGKPKIYELLAVMKNLELIRIVRKKSDHSSGKGAKIFLADPSWYQVLDGDLGYQREALVTAMLEGAGHTCYATDNDTEADLVTPFGICEIGGASKKRKAAKFTVRDEIAQPTPGGGIPLWMVSCLY